MYPWSLQANLFMGGQCTFAIDLSSCLLEHLPVGALTCWSIIGWSTGETKNKPCVSYKVRALHWPLWHDDDDDQPILSPLLVLNYSHFTPNKTNFYYPWLTWRWASHFTIKVVRFCRVNLLETWCWTSANMKCVDSSEMRSNECFPKLGGFPAQNRISRGTPRALTCIMKALYPHTGSRP